MSELLLPGPHEGHACYTAHKALKGFRHEMMKM
jgi:hypothetical protein